jgi:tetratricopeptide (TPR) repeat protein
MKRFLFYLSSVLFVLTLACAPNALAQQRKPTGAKPAAQTKKTGAEKAKTKATVAEKPAASEDALKAELEEIMKLPTGERAARLEEFIKKYSDSQTGASSSQAGASSPSLVRARELLAVAHAALGDEKLRSGDRVGGIELFRAVVAEAPAEMSDKFFAGVVSQLPANLYVLGEREAAMELARAVEERAKENAGRLLMVASFYLGVEQPESAARVAKEALALQPDLAAAHQALGASYRYELRLEDAASEYARALELDPKSASARRTLAELRRATGKPEEALKLYREQLAAEPDDANARSGVVLALFDAGKREEAERELQSALTGEARDLPLLVGASYWHAAHNEGARALELAERAVALEPRFGWAWARIAQGRALLALKRPLEAERALRAARRFGNFPTLDYELAAALAAAGLYDEAAETLSRSFAVRDGEIEARLAGRVESRATDFNELIAPERRASLSQFDGASPAAEAKMLKALLAFYQATRPEALDERTATEAAREFGEGADEMRAYRNLYAASRLEQRGTAPAAVFERAEAAIGGVEPALDLSHAPIALFAETEELRELRQQVVETDAPLSFLNVQRDVLSKVMRGRIEGLAGWALYNQGRTAEAAVRLRRAVSVLPEDTVWWRTAEWRLGAALEASGGGRDALAAYVRSYRAQPDPTRRAAIEALYKRLNNGSLKGLDELLEAPATNVASARAAQPTPDASQPSTTTDAKQPSNNFTLPSNAKTSAPETTPTPVSSEPSPSTTPTPATETTPTATATPSPTTESAPPSPTPNSTATPTPETTPTPATTPTPEATPSPTPAASPTPEATPTPSAQTEATPQAPPEQKPERSETKGSACVLNVSETSLTIQSNGGSATVNVSLDNYAGASPPRINPSTLNWADIIIFAEHHAPSDGNAFRFTITSVSRNKGTFTVTFSTPCGKQDVTINVR